MKRPGLTFVLIAAGLCALEGADASALAEAVAVMGAPAATGIAPTAGTAGATAVRAVHPLGRRLGDEALSRQRGGTDGGGAATLSAAVSNNKAVDVTTGQNTIGGGAFASASGVPVVIQNSGNNVLIQSSTIVNVTVK